MAYAAQAAASSRVIDRLILSTDSEQIAKIGREWGVEVPFLRPPELARDDTPMVPVIEHALAFLEERGESADVIVLLQPTAPLRQPHHVAQAVRMLQVTRCDSIVSVVPVPLHYSPEFVMRVEQGRMRPFLDRDLPPSRQMASRAYSRDGTVYAFWRSVLSETGDLYGRDCRPLILDAGESVNLDSEEDWNLAERRLLRAGQDPLNS